VYYWKIPHSPVTTIHLFVRYRLGSPVKDWSGFADAFGLQQRTSACGDVAVYNIIFIGNYVQ
jgi:hypothetical protein